jgi:hypothetical protein
MDKTVSRYTVVAKDSDSVATFREDQSLESRSLTFTLKGIAAGFV